MPGSRIPIVYTMGKVGSTAITMAIHRAGLPCFDVHSLREVELQTHKFERWHAQAIAINDAILANPAAALIITVAREPVTRNISAFFQNLSIFAPDGVSTPESALALFLKVYPHTLPGGWYKHEVELNLGLDVFSEPFDHRTLSQVMEGPPRLIAFRDDTPDDTKSRLISDALGTEITVRRNFTSAIKDYGNLYRETLDHARGNLPADYIDLMYGTNYVRHFWTPQEVMALRSKWSGSGNHRHEQDALNANVIG